MCEGRNSIVVKTKVNENHTVAKMTLNKKSLDMEVMVLVPKKKPTFTWRFGRSARHFSPNITNKFCEGVNKKKHESLLQEIMPACLVISPTKTKCLSLRLYALA
jgi:hypothetical protein